MDARTALTEAFSSVADPRRVHGCLHRLIDILTIAVCATFSGAESCEEIAQYGRSKEAWLGTFLELANGVPSHDTFLRVLGRIDPRSFQASFAKWLEAVCGQMERRVVAVDGKSVRAAREATATGCLTLVNAWETTKGVALGLVAVPEGSSEKAVWTELLDLLHLEGAVVTLDAGGCTREVADKIVEKGGDYLLAVKGNQKNLRDACEAELRRGLESDFAGMKVSRHDEHDEGHGRVEDRYTMVIDRPKGLPAAWSDMRSLVVVTRERRVGDGPLQITQQFHGASFKAKAEAMAGDVRGHWGVENNLHWVLDVAFNEDANRTTARAGQNLAWIRRFGLSLLKAEPSRLSIKNKRLRCGWDNEFLLKVLNIH